MALYCRWDLASKKASDVGAATLVILTFPVYWGFPADYLYEFAYKQLRPLCDLGFSANFFLAFQKITKRCSSQSRNPLTMDASSPTMLDADIGDFCASCNDSGANFKNCDALPTLPRLGWVHRGDVYIVQLRIL